MLRRLAAYGFALLFIAAGVLHFIMPDFYVRMIPPYFPAPLALVYLSGVAEVVLGALVLPVRTRALAGWALVAMLVAFVPVHIYMVQQPELFPSAPTWALWLRLPLQGLLMLAVWWATKTSDSVRRPSFGEE